MAEELMYNWNADMGGRKRPLIVDDTLRDGLQAPNITFPTLAEKLMLIDCMADNHIDVVFAAYPASSETAFSDSQAILGHINTSGYAIVPEFIGRTFQQDLKPIAELQQTFVAQIKACTFIGCSPIRQCVEGWDMPFILKSVSESIRFLADNALYPIIGIEDSTRCKPQDLKDIILCAVESGARSVTLADTVGHITPSGTQTLVSFVRELVGNQIAISVKTICR